MIIDAFHISLSQLLDGRDVLRAFEERGYHSMFGGVLEYIESALAPIPVRPMLEINGPEVFSNEQDQSVIICRPSPRWSYDPGGRSRVIDFVSVSKEGDVASPRSVCEYVFEVAPESGLGIDASLSERWSGKITGKSRSGKLLEDAAVKSHCQHLYASLGNGAREMSISMDVSGAKSPIKVPAGLWLESLVVDTFSDLVSDLWSGVYVDHDECDVLLNVFGESLLIECKDSNLKLNDISIARAKANRIGASSVLFVVTEAHLHPNVARQVAMLDSPRINWGSDRTDPFPSTTVIAVSSENQFRRDAENIISWMKLHRINWWMLDEEAAVIVPWFQHINAYGEGVPYWRDWYS